MEYVRFLSLSLFLSVFNEGVCCRLCIVNTIYSYFGFCFYLQSVFGDNVIPTHYSPDLRTAVVIKDDSFSICCVIDRPYSYLSWYVIWEEFKWWWDMMGWEEMRKGLGYLWFFWIRFCSLWSPFTRTNIGCFCLGICFAVLWCYCLYGGWWIDWRWSHFVAFVLF